MTDGEEDDRTQRLVAELAEVRRRMSRRAIPAAAPKSKAEGSGENARPTSSPPPSPANGAPSVPRPALGHRIPTQRIVIEQPEADEIPVSRRPTRP